MEIIRSRNQALLNRVESLLRRLDPGTLYPDCVSITVRAQLASRAALLRVEEKLPRNHVTGHTLVPITRVDTQPDMTAFFRDTRPLLAVIGDSGSGKSTLFYQIHQAGDAFISILYDAHQLQVTRTLAARLARDFMCDEHSLDSLFDQFDKVLSPTFRHLVILIDGINESIELKPATLRFEIEELASRLPRSIKIAYSCRRVYWDTFIRSTSPLPRELYTNSKEFIIGHFSPGEAQDAFCVYQDLYGFVGGYATLSAEFKQRIMDPLMLRMLAEGYAGRELPSFAPAVLIFDAYEKQFRQKFLGSVIPNFLDLLVIAKAEKEASTDHSSDQFYTVEIRTNSQLSLLIQQQLVSQNRPGDPLVLLEDEGILTAVDEEKRAYRFAYDRFFEYLLGKALSPLLTSVAGKDFRECLQMQVQRLSPLHFSYLQALKSEIIRLNIVAPNGPYSMYDPLTLRSLLDHPDAGIVIFTKDLIRELMFEGREDLSSVISRIYDEETANHLLMLDVAPDSPRIIPLAIKGLKGTRELARRCCHILAAFLPDPKMVAVVENALLEELRRESLDTEVAAGLIYYTAALVGAADHNDDDPIPAILDFWRRALDILGWTEVTMRVLVDALVIAIRREGPRFFGENDESAIEYPWTIMPREVKDAALKMVPFMVDPGLKVTQELREILLFFCSAIREWSARSDPTGAERFDYNLEYTIAQWILVQRARNNYEEVKEILEWFVSAGYMRAIEVALSNLESCMLHALRDDRALLRDAYQSMLSWMPLLKQDEDSFYCHLDHPDAFSRNECPIDMIGRVSLLDEFSPKEGPVPFLENWLKSADWRDCRYALICARKEWRHSPIKILRTLDLLDETDEKDREVVTEWLDLILKEIYLVHPRLVEDFFWRKKHKKVDIARIQRIKRHSDVVDPSAVIHPGEPLYKAFFLGPRSRREKVGQWYSGLLRSADLKGFCEALVRGFMTDISEQPPPSSFP